MPNRDLEGKIAIITGAGSGIGAGIARVLHDRGATLALCDLFGESAEKTAKNLSEKYIYDSVDVTKISDLEKFRDKERPVHSVDDIHTILNQFEMSNLSSKGIHVCMCLCL